MSNVTHTLINGFCTTCGETQEWLDERGQDYTVETTDSVQADDSLYAVTDPAGITHTRKRGKRVYTHALIRQNKGSDPDHYYVNWASSETNAIKESKVLANQRSYVAIVAL